GISRRRQNFTARIDDLALADEFEPVFDADAVASGDEDTVLGRSGDGRIVGRYLGAFRPVGGQDEDLCTFKGQNAARLRHSKIKADQDPDLANSCIEDLEGAVARADEFVQAKVGQMRLAIEPGGLTGFEDSGGVEEACGLRRGAWG